MKISISTNSKEWTGFEKKEWEKADTEHYGQPINWDKKEFHITAIEDKQTIGSLRMDIRGGIAYVDAIIVSTGNRSKGIGRRLMKEAESIAKNYDAHKIYLETGKDWKATIFYKELGYQITSELPNHYIHVDFVEMTKFLQNN